MIERLFDDQRGLGVSAASCSEEGIVNEETKSNRWQNCIYSTKNIKHGVIYCSNKICAEKKPLTRKNYMQEFQTNGLYTYSEKENEG